MLVSNTEGMGVAMQHMVIEPILWTESDPSAPTDLTEMIFGAEKKKLLNLVLNAVRNQNGWTLEWIEIIMFVDSWI